MSFNWYIFIPLIIFISSIYGINENGLPIHSEECITANNNCENNTECIHRLAVLQSACTTNTCQPQCRLAALNLYQNNLGRLLLRTDASCLPGKDELEKCGFLPNLEEKHCSLQKLVCETDMRCNAKWELFVSECESESTTGNCSPKCQQLLNGTLTTKTGSGFSLCTCTDKEDQLCEHLRDNVIGKCISMSAGSIHHYKPDITIPSTNLPTSTILTTMKVNSDIKLQKTTPKFKIYNRPASSNVVCTSIITFFLIMIANLFI
ncbi:GDNF/GAS1 domain-containing protein [Strongyloides ratti]|uniref:GDNF/GAS1 domain-containing protein n=1 Tax=Strongyloides ratti TaxID=34506 RepID=A0A090KPH6_STRRB|nr:GDNF/GAS1 domain-containing protein [Strongyloides ratti]CEF59259.1 GDNF/GAS1 domain-containing protein [Strongyloides ratti]